MKIIKDELDESHPENPKITQILIQTNDADKLQPRCAFLPG